MTRVAAPSRLPLAAGLGGLVGAGCALAVAALAGGLGGSQVTTVVEPGTGAVVAGRAAAALDAPALYARVAPGVVDITVTTTSSQTGSPFDTPRSGTETAVGAGFVADDRGHIVTAQHVVSGASKIVVSFQNGTRRSARLLGQDDATDLAVVGVDTGGLTLHPLRLGSSAALRVGDAVAAIGNPFRFSRSLSTGLVSGVDRTIEAPNGFTVAHAVQTDAALNPGNSGGPLLGSDGAVVGVVDQIETSGSADQSSGVGFAVPSAFVASELDALIAGRRVTHAYIGLSTSDATGTTVGALVGTVKQRGPAASAGVRAGDVITGMDGGAVTGTGDVVAAVADHRPGDVVTVTVRRGSETRRLRIVLGTQPTDASNAAG